MRATVDCLSFAHVGDFAVSGSGGHAAIHEEVAAGDEAAVRPHDHLYYPSRRQNSPASVVLVEALRYET